MSAKKKMAPKTSAPRKKAAAARPTTSKKAVAKPTPTTTARSGAKPGDVIMIESEKVGSPPREGEILEILHGQISISYRVRWQDGHQSVIAPDAGNTSIVPSQRRR